MGELSVGPLPSDAELEQAIGQAVRLLSAARHPVITGLGTDVAGVVAAFRLAEKIGAALDHDAAQSALRHVAVLRDSGLMLVTPAEAAARADTFLIIGACPFTASPDLIDFLLAAADRRTRILSIGAGDAAVRIAGDAARHVAIEPPAIPGFLAALRARVNGRPIAGTARPDEIDELVQLLRAATYGVAVCAAEELDALAIEMLAGLVKDLNDATRWSTLCIPESQSAAGAMMVAGWMAGLPLRSAFLGGAWQHDEWRFEARRMLAAGEADAAIYICCYEDAPPDWLPDIPAVLLVNAPEIPLRRQGIRIDIGQPGRDHDGILYDRRSATLVRRRASAPSRAPSVAHVLERIAARLAPP